MAIIVFAGMAAAALWLFFYAFSRESPTRGYYSSSSGVAGGGSAGWNGRISDDDPILRRRRRQPVSYNPVRAPFVPPPPAPALDPEAPRDVFDPPPVASTSAPPPKIRRGVLSSERVEHEFLTILRDAPADASARAVYGDWLEERGFVAKAKFVRGTDEYADHVVIRDETDTDWRAITCHERVRCDGRECPRAWNAFEPVADDERVRHCGACSKVVRYCGNLDEVYASSSRGERAVLDLAGRLPSRRS